MVNLSTLRALKDHGNLPDLQSRGGRSRVRVLGQRVSALVGWSEIMVTGPAYFQRLVRLDNAALRESRSALTVSQWGLSTFYGLNQQDA